MPEVDTLQFILEVKGESYFLAPNRLLGVVEYVISGKIRVRRSHPYYW